MAFNIHILFEFKKGPYGGANQFLKALRRELRQLDRYQENIEEADVILANVNPGSLLPLLQQMPALKRRYPKTIIIARLDGPISLIRGRDQYVDKVTAQFIKLFADGIIFQSRWSQENNRKLFDICSIHQTVIHNAVDNSIFYPNAVSSNMSGGKIKIIASSWSSNWRKGFEIYQYLDDYLNWSKYEMTFIGNSPVQFKNIKLRPAVSSVKLAHILRQHDIYITASKNDPCSNALIESMSCGLPSIALDSGGHSELIKNGGMLFRHKNDLIKVIDQLVSSYKLYKKKLSPNRIFSSASQYLGFSEVILANGEAGNYYPKKISAIKELQVLYLKNYCYLMPLITFVPRGKYHRGF